MVPVALIGAVFFFICTSKINEHNVYLKNQATYAQITQTLAQSITQTSTTTDLSKIDATYTMGQSLLARGYALHINSTKLDQLKAQLIAIEDTAHHIIGLTDPQVLSDLSISYPNTQLTSVSIFGNSLITVSPSTNSAYILDANTVSGGTKITNSLLINPISICNFDSNSGIMYDKKNGVLSIDAKGNVSPIAGLSDIQNITSIACFGSNIYFLDSTDQIIYKSVSTGNGYGIAFADITDATIASSGTIAVDGNIFLSSTISAQGVIRYYGAKATPFTIGEISMIGKPLGPITYIYDTEHLADLYLLDPQNSRIIVLAKPTGTDTITYNYVKQYIYTGKNHLFDNLSGIAIDNIEKNMYVLDGSKVLKINL